MSTTQTIANRLLDAIENEGLYGKLERRADRIELQFKDANGCLGIVEVDPDALCMTAAGDAHRVVVSSGRGEPWTIDCECIEDAQTIAISIMTCINPEWPNSGSLE